MVWVNTKISEGSPIEDLTNVMESNGWGLESKYSRMVIPSDFIKPKRITIPVLRNDDFSYIPIPQEIKRINSKKYRNYYLFKDGEEIVSDILGPVIVIERDDLDSVDMYISPIEEGEILETSVGIHYIFQSIFDERFILGISFYLEIKESVFSLLNNNSMPITVPGVDRMIIKNEEDCIGSILNKTMSKRVFPSSWYVYSLKSLSDHLLSDHDISIIKNSFIFFSKENDDIKRVCLDVETETYWNEKEEVKSKGYPQIMQSPIIEMNLRKPDLEDYSYDNTLKIKKMNTNWWKNSKISVVGRIDSRTIFLIFQTDNTPSFEGNVIPAIPLYFGDLDKPQDSGRGETTPILIAGTVPNLSLDEIKSFEFDNTEITQTPIFPLLKSYKSYPGNGIDNVMMRRTNNGSFYQRCYLSWNTISDLARPNRKSSEGYQYPRSYYGEDEFLYQFNPSGYSEENENNSVSSKIYVIHPEDGILGSLRFCIAINPLSLISGMDKLKVRRECPSLFDIYSFRIIESVSPFTKRPGTPYRYIGIGLLELSEKIIEEPYLGLDSFGTYENRVSVSFISNGNAIIYTTDETNPIESETSIDYLGPFVIEETTTINVVATDGEGNFSEVVTGEFIITPIETPEDPPEDPPSTDGPTSIPIKALFDVDGGGPIGRIYPEGFLTTPFSDISVLQFVLWDLQPQDTLLDEVFWTSSNPEVAEVYVVIEAPLARNAYYHVRFKSVGTTTFTISSRTNPNVNSTFVLTLQ